MRVEVREVSPVVREVVVEVPPEAVSAELDRIYRDLRRRVKVPGFRPGHIPRSVLEQRYGSDVREEAAKHLVAETLPGALKEAGVVPVAEPAVQRQPLAGSQPLRYTARCEVKPAIDVRDYFDVEVEAAAADLSDGEVEAELERLREQRAELRPVEGRNRIEAGDYVVLDYDGTIDGRPFEGGSARDRVLQVGSGSTIPGFEDRLLGAELGRERTFTLDLPAEMGNKKVAGKRAQFRVQVKEIKEKFVPALDDELAQSLGAQSVADLRGKVRAELERRARIRAERETNERLVDAILARNPFDVPPSLVEAEVESGLREAQVGLSMMGIDPRSVPFGERQIRQDLRSRAERRARRRLLLEAIADRESIEVGDDDLDAQIRAYSEATGQALAKVRQTYAKPERRERLRAQVREEKVLDLLRSRARIKPAELRGESQEKTDAAGS